MKRSILILVAIVLALLCGFTTGWNVRPAEVEYVNIAGEQVRTLVISMKPDTITITERVIDTLFLWLSPGDTIAVTEARGFGQETPYDYDYIPSKHAGRGYKKHVQAQTAQRAKFIRWRYKYAVLLDSLKWKDKVRIDLYEVWPKQRDD